MEKRKEKRHWLTTKTIRFDRKKLSIAKKKKLMTALISECRAALDRLVSDQSPETKKPIDR